jgi:hypothetical protein
LLSEQEISALSPDVVGSRVAQLVDLDRLGQTGVSETRLASTATAATAVISPPSPTVAATSAQNPVRTPSSRWVGYAASTLSSPTNCDSSSSSNMDDVQHPALPVS